jgi:hypothetical protein
MNTLKITNITSNNITTERILNLTTLFTKTYAAKILKVDHVHKTVIIECPADKYAMMKQRFEQFQFREMLFGRKEQMLEIVEM